MSVERINAAIRDCLDRCYASQVPFATWSAYINRLWADTSWNKADVEQVHRATRRILKALVTDEGDNLDDEWSESTMSAQGASEPSERGGR